MKNIDPELEQLHELHQEEYGTSFLFI